MQIYKNIKMSKYGFVLCLLFFVNAFLFSNSMEMPEVPSMPSMPAISFDGNFYKPSLPYGMTGNSKNKDSKTYNSYNNTVISGVDDVDSLFSSVFEDDSTLTAGDISYLHDSGLFSDLGSLSSVLIPNNNSVNSAKTDILLQNILKELDELKKEQKKASPEEKKNFSDNKKDSENFDLRNPSVLRFKINGYDIKDSLVNVFLSKPEQNGSFLFTADREYVANGKTREETFYLLFENKKTAVSPGSYNVVSSLAQDYKNENSFIYKLCHIDNLNAERIGNLVVMKYSDKKFSVDLLIDLDKK